MLELHSDEKILKEFRRHWLTLLETGLAMLLLAAFPFVVEGFLNSFESVRGVIRHYQSHILLLESAWLLILWMNFAIAWTSYYLNVLVITNHRVIDIQQISLFKRNISELRLENIEDIAVEIPGFLASWLDYGNITLQTAGEHDEFIFENVHHPELAKDFISNCCEAHIDELRATGVVPEKAIGKS
ncbi:MAG: hypothetical protein V1489_01655 [Candidatus Liptonbacteria bacterium]